MIVMMIILAAGFVTMTICFLRTERALKNVRKKYEGLRENLQYFTESKNSSDYILCLKISSGNHRGTYYDVSDIRDEGVNVYFKQHEFDMHFQGDYDELRFRTFLCKRGTKKEIERRD